MKKILFVIGLLALMASGCSSNPLPRISVEDQVKQAKICKDAGLKASFIHEYDGFGSDEGIVAINCDGRP